MRIWILLLAAISLGAFQMRAITIRFSSPSFDIRSGHVTLVAAATLTPQLFGSVLLPDGFVHRLSSDESEHSTLRIQNGSITMQLSDALDDFIAVFADLVVLRRDGREIRVGSTSSARIHLDRKVRAQSVLDVELPFVAILTVKVHGVRDKPLGSTGISIVGEDSTLQLKTDEREEVKLLVIPGDYDIRFDDRNGQGVQLKIGADGPDEILVHLNRV